MPPGDIIHDIADRPIFVRKLRSTAFSSFSQVRPGVTNRINRVL